MVDGLPVILFQISKRVLWLRDITIFPFFWQAARNSSMAAIAG